MSHDYTYLHRNCTKLSPHGCVYMDHNTPGGQDGGPGR